ncbi:DUF4296 domain-containing protein [Pontibacter pudoricolor]|uniref:DUF4296 domain-containing protein n=1 Tax=Pontibacter pudoricolor TaxID=2694930 RepID=UPI001EE48498|nr:DUF4296 domain-containing protein [Pontibacter pudoricolor]
MKRLFYILFCLVLLGCQQQEDTAKPAGMVPEGKMVQILADVHIMEALIEANINYPDTAMMVYNKEHKKILDKYGVKQPAFQKTYNYYAANLKEMDRLYEIVLDTLTAREAKYVAKKSKGAGDRDSLQLDQEEVRDETPGKLKNTIRRSAKMKTGEQLN